MSWIDLVDNPEGLKAVFGPSLPSLVATEVHEVRLIPEGQKLVIRLDLAEYPADPPLKWRTNGFNTVQLQLLFGGVQKVDISGISFGVIADLEIRSDNGVILDLRSNSLQVHAVASWLYISEMSAYVNTEREAIN